MVSILRAGSTKAATWTKDVPVNQNLSDEPREGRDSHPAIVHDVLHSNQIALSPKPSGFSCRVWRRRLHAAAGWHSSTLGRSDLGHGLLHELPEYSQVDVLESLDVEAGLSRLVLPEFGEKLPVAGQTGHDVDG